MLKPEPGYRYFRCLDCEHEWVQHSRDKTSPSGEECPKCYENDALVAPWCMATIATLEEIARLKPTV